MTMEAHGTGTGTEQRSRQPGIFISRKHDRAGSEVRIQSSGKAATDDQLIRVLLKGGVETAFGVLAADACDEAIHPWLRKELCLLLDSEAEQHSLEPVRVTFEFFSVVRWHGAILYQRAVPAKYDKAARSHERRAGSIRQFRDSVPRPSTG